MSWTCPKCQKTYTKVNQSHKCETEEIDILLKQDERLIGLFDLLLSQITGFGEMRVTTSKKAITLYRSKGFLMVYPKKDSLDLGFFLPRQHEGFPVYKSCASSKTKFVNWVRVYDQEDLSPFLNDLLREAWEIA